METQFYRQGDKLIVVHGKRTFSVSRNCLRSALTKVSRKRHPCDPPSVEEALYAQLLRRFDKAR